MSNFKYKRNQLYCEDVQLKEVAESAGTPLYIYSEQSLIDKYKELKQAFAFVKPLICYSVKANSNLAICSILTKQGAGLDIVSGGELYRATKIKANCKKIVFAGVGKTEQEIKQAIKANILLINAESKQEVERIDEIADKLGKRVQIGLRLNPNISAGGHGYIQTAKEENKFGISLQEIKEIFLQKEKFPHLDICGIHFHLGSQITHPQPFVKALKKTISLIQQLGNKQIKISYLDIGGGFFQPPLQFAQAILPLIKNLKAKLILEPGRYLTAGSGILLTKVLYIKERKQGKKIVIVDAGMNDFLRPSLYDAHHEILPVIRTPNNEHRTTNTDIVGPVCESGDFFAKDRKLALFKNGDFLAVLDTGAYGFSMASNYNSRLRPAEVLIKGNKFFLVREREEYKDLIRREKILTDGG